MHTTFTQNKKGKKKKKKMHSMTLGGYIVGTPSSNALFPAQCLFKLRASPIPCPFNYHRYWHWGHLWAFEATFDSILSFILLSEYQGLCISLP